MADRVLPVVRKLFVCTDAVYLMVDEKTDLWKWQLTEPLSIAAFPPDVSGNFDVERLWIYAQFAGAIGEFDLHVRMQRIRLEAGKEVAENPINEKSDSCKIDFQSLDRLWTRDFAFEWINAPFDAPGIYRFSVWSNYVQLPGATAELRVLDGKEKL